MADKRKLAFFTSLALAGSVLTAAAASAATCPASESFFGTIERVNGNMLTVRTPSGHWADVAINSGARINTNGYTLRSGMYVGAYGCVTPNGVFHANEVSLSSNQSSYSEQISGVVRSIGSGRITVAERNGQYGSWYVPDTDEFHVGQSVTGTGMRAANGAFYPQSINGHSIAYDTDVNSMPGMAVSNSVTLTGTVQRVGTNTLQVWEPSSRHSGKWVVPNAGRFRVGQRVSATGREDRRGTFYVQEITIL